MFYNGVSTQNYRNGVVKDDGIAKEREARRNKVVLVPYTHQMSVPVPKKLGSIHHYSAPILPALILGQEQSPDPVKSSSPIKEAGFRYVA